MIRKLIGRKIDAAEKGLGESHDHLRFILRVSLSAFLCFSKIFAIANYRKVLPIELYHAARIVAARDEDCGTCVQLEINLAQKAGVASNILQTLIDQEYNKLSDDLLLTCRYVEAVVKKQNDEIELREQLKPIIGDQGLVELSFAVGASRFLPIVKRMLGYGTACSQVRLMVNK